MGSVSKQFTAAAIGLLAAEGRLSLDDDIRKWFPELPDYGAPVTVRHLVHHTSGMRDVYALMAMRGDRMEDVQPDSVALSLILRQKGLGFRPNTQYSYSNSGYYLLAQIVKRVTGRTLREYADSALFRPLGMTRTHFHDDAGHVMKWRAMSYEADGKGGFRISYLQNFDKVGAGGLYSTLDDLRKWDRNYYTHQVGGEALQRIIHTRAVIASGDTLPYAFGNTVTTHRGLRVTEHGGALMGYKAYLLRFPDERFSVLLTCNLGSIDPGPLAHAVAEVYLGDRMQPATPRAAASSAASSTRDSSIAATAADADALVGSYYSEDLDATYRVERAPDGRLMLRAPGRAAAPLLATGADTYRAGSTTVRFERPAAAAPPAAMVLRVARIGEMRLVRKDAPPR